MILTLLAAGTLLFLAVSAGAKKGQAKPSTDGARDYTRAQAEKWLDSQMGAASGPLVLNIKKRGPSGMWVLDGASPIEGVEYRYFNDDKSGKVTRDIEVTPNMLALLVRLSRYLRSEGVTRVVHAGIFPGRSTDAHNAHNRGDAIDLSEFRFKDGDKLNVLEDWGKKPKAAHVVKGENFRLLPTEKGGGFFRRLYSFLSQEATDRGPGRETTQGTAIGESSYIITPDHPTPYLAASHLDHVHAQTGPTTY